MICSVCLFVFDINGKIGALMELPLHGPTCSSSAPHQKRVSSADNPTLRILCDMLGSVAGGESKN